MREATRLTSKGQVVIPKKVRDRLSWRPGTRLEVLALPDGVELRRAEPARGETDRLIADLRGCLIEGDALAAHEAEHRAEVETDERRRRR